MFSLSAIPLPLLPFDLCTQSVQSEGSKSCGVDRELTNLGSFCEVFEVFCNISEGGTEYQPATGWIE